MEVEDLRTLFLGFHFAVPAGWLCMAAALFFAFRRPVANAFLNLTLVGIGGAPLLGGFTYARLSAFVAIFTLIMQMVRRKESGAIRGIHVAREPLLWFAGICVLILAKILFETAIYGLDSSRATFLRAGLIEVLFPLSVISIGIARGGPELAARDLLVGMATFPTAMVLGYLPFAFREGLLSAALQGSWRLTIGGADTINSARVFAYGALAAFTISLLPKKRAGLTSLLLRGLSAGFILLLVLTGNRQYLLGLLAFLCIWAFCIEDWRRRRWLAGPGAALAIAFILCALIVSGKLTLGKRLAISDLKEELIVSRGAIWEDALSKVLEHSWLGVGFKNFGVEVDSGIDQNGNTVMIRESAHGVIQDVLTEHGLWLGSAFIIGSIQLVLGWWQVIRHGRRLSARKGLAAILVSLLIPLLFSSAFVNATPLYLLLVMALMRVGKRPAKLPRSWDGRMPAASGDPLRHGFNERGGRLE
jgi:O-antigen ligase